MHYWFEKYLSSSPSSISLSTFIFPCVRLSLTPLPLRYHCLTETIFSISDSSHFTLFFSFGQQQLQEQHLQAAATAAENIYRVSHNEGGGLGEGGGS